MKQGDRVVLNEEYGSHAAGKKGMVTYIAEDDGTPQEWLVSVTFDDGGTATCYMKRLTKVVSQSPRGFQAGDRVKVVKQGSGFNHESKGIIVTLKDYSKDGYGGKPGWTIVESVEGSNNNGGRVLWFNGYHGEDSFEALPAAPLATMDDAKALIEAVDSLEDAKAELEDAKERVASLEADVACLKAKLNIK